jgi:hypothetical protein
LYGLTNDIAYTVKVAAVNEAGTGTYSAESPSFIPAPSLMAVTALIATATADGNILLDWDQPDALIGEFQHYEIYVKAKGGTYESVPTGVISDSVSRTDLEIDKTKLPGYVAPVETPTVQVTRVLLTLLFQLCAWLACECFQ